MAKKRFTKTLLLSSLMIVIAGNFSYAADDDGDSAPKQARRAAEYDVALTEGLLRYAHDVRSGLPPHDAYRDVLLPNVDFDASTALKRALRQHTIHAFLIGLPPQRAEYRELVAALATYRTIAANGGWPSIKSAGDIDLDGNDPRVKTLVKRLALEDPVFGANPQPMAEDIQDAIVRFQTRNGIEPDGHIGRDTLAA